MYAVHGTKRMVRGIQIGEVAPKMGLTVYAIRFYEKQRLLRKFGCGGEEAKA